MKTSFIKLTVIALFLISIFAVISCRQNTNSSSLDSLIGIKSAKTIRAAYLVYPPTVSVDKDPAAPSGFLIDVMNEIAKRAGLTVTYSPTSFDDFQVAIASNRTDIIVGGVFVNPARAREMSLTVPIMYWSGVMAVGDIGTAQKFSSLAELNAPGVRVAVTAGTAEHEFVKENLPKANIDALPNSDISLTLTEVTAHRADVAFADAVTIRKFMKTNSGVVAMFDGEQFNLFAAAFAVKQGDQNLLNFLNSSILALQVDGTIDTLSKKYNGANIWILPRKPWE